MMDRYLDKLGPDLLRLPATDPTHQASRNVFRVVEEWLDALYGEGVP